uniref:Uncharacterized protein n=1 Tax=Arundo donax TaxID=35708 RepID=A0A0A8YQZ9_ARUDO
MFMKCSSERIQVKKI